MSASAPAPRDPSRPAESAAERYLQVVRLLALGDRELRLVLAQMAKLHGLSETQALVIHCCHRPEGGPGVSQSELAEQVGLSPAQISDTVDRLRGRALIAGQRAPDDRRRQVWLATESGRQCIGQLLSELDGWATPFFARLATADFPPLDDLLGRLMTAARDANGQAANRSETSPEALVSSQQRKVA